MQLPRRRGQVLAEAGCRSAKGTDELGGGRHGRAGGPCAAGRPLGERGRPQARMPQQPHAPPTAQAREGAETVVLRPLILLLLPRRRVVHGRIIRERAVTSIPSPCALRPSWARALGSCAAGGRRGARWLTHRHLRRLGELGLGVVNRGHVRATRTLRVRGLLRVATWRGTAARPAAAHCVRADGGVAPRRTTRGRMWGRPLAIEPCALRSNLPATFAAAVRDASAAPVPVGDYGAVLRVTGVTGVAVSLAHSARRARRRVWLRVDDVRSAAWRRAGAAA